MLALPACQTERSYGLGLSVKRSASLCPESCDRISLGYVNPVGSIS